MSEIRRFDTLVIGSGIAGLFAALQAARLGTVALVTKSALEESNTRYAQGGIAAVMFDDDDVDLHAADTLAAGAGLCDAKAVRILCTEGPARIRDLLRIGVKFDRQGSGLARGLEAAHCRSRVLHAGGDATGARIESALASAVRHSGVTVLENTFLTDLAIANQSVSGAHFLGSDERHLTLYAGAVILASGGAGQVYSHSTNPTVATGDGAAAAWRAGAVVRDAEFYQFHPTALALPGTYLVSEAVRGEGAVLRNSAGRRFMESTHPLAELAPRDVVARAIAEQLAEGETVYLDATTFDAAFLAERFPSIDTYCRTNGFDWSRRPVPVTPAAHYWMGGVATDCDGRTSLSGLYAIGEVACSGVHGANRLASNSLLEGLVFGARAVDAIESADQRPVCVDDVATLQPSDSPPQSFSRLDVQRLMWDRVGLMRNDADLEIAAKQLGVWTDKGTGRSEREDTNLATVAALIVAGARSRLESRGAHYRSDHPQPSPEFERHISFRREP